MGAGAWGSIPQVRPSIYLFPIYSMPTCRIGDEQEQERGRASMLVGYARVSTTEQDTTLQLDALQGAGVHRIYQEKRSAVAKRPVLDQMLSDLSPGNVVVVYKVDRFARSLVHLLNILDRIEQAGATFKSITEPIDTASLAGRMMMQMLGSFAEFERGMIRERSMAGQRAAMLRGVHCGRARSLLPDDEVMLVSMWKQGWYTIDTLSHIFNVHPSSVKRAIYRVVKPDHSSLK